MISKDTMLYISIAAQPSNFGTTLFNAAFAAMKINALYKACEVSAASLPGAVAGIRALSIKGAGVSMPHKQAVIQYLNSLDPAARRIGAANTIVNNHGRLKGYNTDYEGALIVLRQIKKLSQKTVLLLGAGGVAQAISCALHAIRPAKVIVSSRQQTDGEKLVRKWRFVGWQPWPKRHSIQADVLINATSIGMAPRDRDCPISINSLNNYSAVMDVVLSPPETTLLREAKKRGLQALAGAEMSLEQALRQFTLYTGQQAPRTVMKQAMQRLWSKTP